MLPKVTRGEHERARYLSRRKYITDLYNDIQVIKEQGFKEGEKIGILKGEKKGIMLIARKLKKAGTMSLEQIAQMSGLSIEKIEKL